MKTLASLLLAGLVVACASTPEGPPPLEAVGEFAFTTTVDGQPMSGTFHVQAAGEGYRGRVVTDMMPELPITAVSVTGQQMVLDIETPDGIVEVRITFTGNDFSGTWSMGMEGGSIRGHRVTG